VEYGLWSLRAKEAKEKEEKEINMVGADRFFWRLSALSIIEKIIPDLPG